MRKHYKSRFPIANVKRLNEVFATDTIFSDTSALNDGIPGHGGSTMLRLFSGCSSHFLFGLYMNSEKEFPDAFTDFIQSYGAPKALFSDNTKSEVSACVLDILRQYCIGQQLSEPHEQNQNPAERRSEEID